MSSVFLGRLGNTDRETAMKTPESGTVIPGNGVAGDPLDRGNARKGSQQSLPGWLARLRIVERT